jgi:hypothetical protein
VRSERFVPTRPYHAQTGNSTAALMALDHRCEISLSSMDAQESRFWGGEFTSLVDHSRTAA